MFSMYEYPIIDKAGFPLCDLYGDQLELKEVVQMHFIFKKNGKQTTVQGQLSSGEGGEQRGLD
jgi:hypothetical protein